MSFYVTSTFFMPTWRVATVSCVGVDKLQVFLSMGYLPFPTRAMLVTPPWGHGKRTESSTF
jgi:hypothetical protein